MSFWNQGNFFQFIKRLYQKQQNIAKIPIMDTDSMDIEGIFLTE